MLNSSMERIIFTHACIAGGISLLSIPVITELAEVANMFAMYSRINDELGIKLSDNVLRGIGSYLLSQLAGAAGGLMIAVAAAIAARFIPFVGIAASFASAAPVGFAIWTCGYAYAEMMGDAIKAAGGRDAFVKLSDERKTELLKQVSPGIEKLKEFVEMAKAKLKGVDFAAYKDQAKEYADEAKNNSSRYEGVWKK